MKLKQNDIEKIENFLAKIENDTYPEPFSEPHFSITQKMISYFFEKYPLPADSKILDIGCGQGVALEHFSGKNLSSIGITLNDEDLRICLEKGYHVLKMDQSFLDFDDHEFNFIWCRHCIEHSVFPYFTLSEFFRVLKPEGYLYLEVPAPDTSCNHQNNKNHYSVLGKNMWIELSKRSGFHIHEVLDLSFNVPAGPDVYWAMIQQKP